MQLIELLNSPYALDALVVIVCLVIGGGMGYFVAGVAASRDQVEGRPLSRVPCAAIGAAGCFLSYLFGTSVWIQSENPQVSVLAGKSGEILEMLRLIRAHPFAFALAGSPLFAVIPALVQLTARRLGAGTRDAE